MGFRKCQLTKRDEIKGGNLQEGGKKKYTNKKKLKG
jgi:hypothetical protein